MLIKELCLFLVYFLSSLVGNKVENVDRFVDNCLIGSYEYSKYNVSSYNNCIRASGGDKEFIIGCLVSDTFKSMK